jgi:hypothetical protein
VEEYGDRVRRLVEGIVALISIGSVVKDLTVYREAIRSRCL